MNYNVTVRLRVSSLLLMLNHLHKNPLNLPYSPTDSHGKVVTYPKFTHEFGIYLYWTRFMPNLTDLYKLDQFNDTFALGHYARVLDAQDRRNGQSVAFKL